MEASSFRLQNSRCSAITLKGDTHDGSQHKVHLLGIKQLPFPFFGYKKLPT